MAPRKLVLVIVDSLRTDMLERTAAAGEAPILAELLSRGELVARCASSFPSVTPVCTSEITTGVRPDRHWIPGMNWFHRAEQRYVEYGSSWSATRAFGLFSALYDTVYNLNMAHLSPAVETIYERLGDAGVRTACTPFLIFRGRTRHELGLDGLLRRAATAAKFHHAVWGPDELFYGELYASRKVPCKPTLARPNTRDGYSGCVGRELVEQDLYDFLLFSLPDNDYHSHRFGPAETEASISRADRSLAEIVEAAGGIDPFLEDHGVIVMADHAQSEVHHELPLGEILAESWRVLQPSAERPEDAELAYGPSSRAGAIWVLKDGGRGRRLQRDARTVLGGEPGVELLAWLEDHDGEVAVRDRVGAPGRAIAVVSRGGAELRFSPGDGDHDLRGNRWSWRGEPLALGLESSAGTIDSPGYPDAFARLWAALNSPFAGDILFSLAPGHELVDWGGTSHVPGGSHGSLAAEDSLGPLLTVGLEGKRPTRDHWAISDVAGLVAGHFAAQRHPRGSAAQGAAR
jgi:hypothetical protein